MVFEGGPRGIYGGRHDPLRTGEGLVQGRTVDVLIFTRILKVFLN